MIHLHLFTESIPVILKPDKALAVDFYTEVP